MLIAAIVPLLVNPEILEFKVERSDKSLAPSVVTFARLTSPTVAEFILFNCAAVTLLLSSPCIVIA